MRQPNSPALSQNYRAVAVERKALSGVSEREMRCGVNRLAGSSRPQLRCQHVSGNELVTNFGIQICSEQRFLCNGFLFGAMKISWVGCAKWAIDLLETCANQILRIIEHREAAL